MGKVGGDQHALATILDRIADKENGVKILPDHPPTKDRVAAIVAIASRGATRPLLDAGRMEPAQADLLPRARRRTQRTATHPPQRPGRRNEIAQAWRYAGSLMSRSRGWPSGPGALRCSRSPRRCSPPDRALGDVGDRARARDLAGALLLAVIGILLAFGAFT